MKLVPQMIDDVLPEACGSAFRRMDIAEQEIKTAKAGTRNSAKRTKMHRAFGVLCPPEVMRNKSDDVYRSHVRELLARAAEGLDLDVATDAECVCFMSAMTIKAPPTSAFAAAYTHLFCKVLPSAKLGQMPGHEGYPGEVEEIVNDTRRKITALNRAKENSREKLFLSDRP